MSFTSQHRQNIITLLELYTSAACRTMASNSSQDQERLIGSVESENNYNIADDDTNESSCVFLLNTIVSGTARLNVLLPTAIILAFTIFTPILTNDGQCNTLDRWLMGIFLVILATSCVFFSFTDSFKTANGGLYFGVATLQGIWTFNGGKKKPCVPSDYKLRWADLFHAFLSLIAFLTLAGSHSDVFNCYNVELPRKVTNTVPLVVGFVISVLYVMFPSRRRGIGHPFLLESDALNGRD